MIKRAFLGVLLFGLIAPSSTFSQFKEFKIIESTFCTSVKNDQYDRPYWNKISLSKIEPEQDGEKRIFFWTKVQVDEEKDIMHVWSAEGREKWAEPVHVSRTDKVKNLAVEIFEQVKGYLRIKFNNSQQDLCNVQGVILGTGRSPRFRTHSKIKAKPGIYTVEVYDLNNKLVPGGEAKP